MHPVEHGAVVRRGLHYCGTLVPVYLFQIAAVYFEFGHHCTCPEGQRPIDCQLAIMILGKFSPKAKLAAGFPEFATSKVTFIP